MWPGYGGGGGGDGLIPTITLLPVGCGGWSLLLGDLWSGVESR